MLELSLNAFITLFVVNDPVGVATLFAALTFGEAEAYRRRMALKGTLISATILLLFTLSGDWLLATLGIGLPAFRIAGARCCTPGAITKLSSWRIAGRPRRAIRSRRGAGELRLSGRFAADFLTSCVLA
ncbi:MAG TPA: MarC family protein [Chloroflexota bacterium]|nr:MarC family protein [Chloroflexota bacterium]